MTDNSGPYAIGQIVNGHRWTGSGWEPLHGEQPPPPPPDQHQSHQPPPPPPDQHQSHQPPPPSADPPMSTHQPPPPPPDQHQSHQPPPPSADPPMSTHQPPPPAHAEASSGASHHAQTEMNGFHWDGAQWVPGPAASTHPGAFSGNTPIDQTQPIAAYGQTGGYAGAGTTPYGQIPPGTSGSKSWVGYSAIGAAAVVVLLVVGFGGFRLLNGNSPTPTPTVAATTQIPTPTQTPPTITQTQEPTFSATQEPTTKPTISSPPKKTINGSKITYQGSGNTTFKVDAGTDYKAAVMRFKVRKSNSLRATSVEVTKLDGGKARVVGGFGVFESSILIPVPSKGNTVTVKCDGDWTIESKNPLKSKTLWTSASGSSSQVFVVRSTTKKVKFKGTGDVLILEWTNGTKTKRVFEFRGKANGTATLRGGPGLLSVRFITSYPVLSKTRGSWTVTLS